MMRKLIQLNWLLVLMGGLLVVLGLMGDVWWGRVSAGVQNDGHSSAFHGGEVRDPLLPPQDKDVKQINVPRFVFYSDVPEDKKVVKISFMYKCVSGCRQLWLSLRSKPEVVDPRFVLQHEVFNDLNWFYIEEDGLFFYQKKINYSSISKFISQVKGKSVGVDKSVALLKGVFGENVKYLESLNTASGLDYIYTTYKRPRYMGEWREFVRTLSIEGANRNEEGYLVWEIETILGKNEGMPELWMTIPSIEQL